MNSHRSLWFAGLCLAGILSSASPSFCQVFGEVNITDFNVDEKYRDADAVILSDQGQSTFYENDGSFDIRFIRSTRILILKKEGLDYANVAIHYFQDGYGRTELVDEVEAYTYNVKNSTIVKEPLDPNTIYEDKIDEEWKAKKFAMPDVHEGSIVEYKYTLRTPFMFHLPDWQFQNRVPTKFSSYEVRLIPFYEYTFFLQGASAFDDHQSYVSKGMKRHFGQIEYRDMVHIYTMKDVPPFEDESYITTPDDYLIKLDFQLAKINYPTGGSREIFTTWEDLCQEFLKNEDYGKWQKQAENQAEKILKDNSEFQTADDKIEWIVKYVKQHFEWNGSYSCFAKEKVKDFLSTKKGNSGEINLFLGAMFRAAGIECDMVLISTRQNGRIKDSYPLASQFNNTVCLVTGKAGLMLADGTEDWLPFNAIPPRDINGKGLVVTKQNVNWVTLQGTGQSMDMVNFKWKLSGDKQLEGLVDWVGTGYDAFYELKSFYADHDDFKSYLEQHGLENISALKVEDPTDNVSRFRAACQAQLPVEDLGKNIMFSPFAGLPPSANSFKYPARKYHVDMIYASSRIFSSSIDIPEGYSIEEVPDNQTISNDLVTFHYTTIMVDNVLQIKGDLQYKKSIYAPSEYPLLRSSMTSIVKKLNDKIILAKNEL